MLVEVPADALAGAALHLRADADGRFDDEAVIPLDVTAEQAGDWGAATAPVEVEAPHAEGVTP